MIAIRPAEDRDAPEIAAIYAPHVEVGVVSFETEAPDAETIRQRMRSSDGLYPWIVATRDEDDALLGYAYASRFREREAYRFIVETTIYMAPGAQRQGAGRLLYQTLLDTLTAQNFTQAIGVIALPNQGSVRVHEAVGFRLAGTFREVGYKFGEWIDVGYWQCPLAPSLAEAPELRKFTDVGVVRS
jgi:phosphinothricin acetyltransferase